MKKAILICAIYLAGSKAFSQADESLTEEKSSEWIKVRIASAPPATRTASKPAPSTTTRRTAPPVQQAPSQPKPEEAFNKTNSQVKRFKKGKTN